MNDSRELFDAVDILQKVGIELGEPIYIQLANTITSLRHNPPSMMHFFFSGFFIASFSKEDDLLDMWRGYGQNGQKYSIEFDSESLLQQIQNEYPDGDFKLKPCLYFEKDKIQAMRTFIQQTPHPNNTQQIGHQQSIEIQTAWLHEFYQLALTFKNSGFKSEQEVRIIGRIHDTNLFTHRVNQFGITPYLEVTLTQPCISSFRIGPTEDRSLVMYSITSLLKKSVSNGSSVLITEDNEVKSIKVKVHFSDTSYRQK